MHFTKSPAYRHYACAGDTTTTTTTTISGGGMGAFRTFDKESASKTKSSFSRGGGLFSGLQI